MQTITSLESISDQKLYDINDLVKADAGGCENCSACCYGVGDLVILTPFDVYALRSHLSVSFELLLKDKLVLETHDKIKLPHLKTSGEAQRCAFLGGDNRCEVHANRPNICRLFPLGRVYEEDDFKYFLQVGACVKPSLGKIKVKKWIQISNYKENKAFLLSWYKLLKALAFRLKFVRDEQELHALNAYLQMTFYQLIPEEHEDFYTAFMRLLPEAKNHLGIL